MQYIDSVVYRSALFLLTLTVYDVQSDALTDGVGDGAGVDARMRYPCLRYCQMADGAGTFQVRANAEMEIKHLDSNSNFRRNSSR